MKYVCKLCSYNTNDRKLWYKHINTVKHEQKNISETFEYLCNFCKCYYSSKSNLQRHQKICAIKNKENVITEKDDKISTMADDVKKITFEFRSKLENEMSKNVMMHRILEEKETLLREKENIIKDKDFNIANIIKDKDKIVDILSKENQFHKDLVVGIKSSDNKHISGLSYVIHNYSQAPSLTFEKEKMSPLADTDDAVDALIKHKDKGSLHVLIGDAFVNVYKKDNPKNQSLWSTDVSRVNFLVREFVKEHDKDMWTIDKKGIKTKTITLTPLIKHLNFILDKHIVRYGKIASEMNEKIKKSVKYTSVDMEENVNLLKKISSVGELKIKLLSSELIEQILKRISPYFYCDKSKQDYDTIVDGKMVLEHTKKIATNNKTVKSILKSNKKY